MAISKAPHRDLAGAKALAAGFQNTLIRQMGKKADCEKYVADGIWPDAWGEPKPIVRKAAPVSTDPDDEQQESLFPDAGSSPKPATEPETDVPEVVVVQAMPEAIQETAPEHVVPVIADPLNDSIAEAISLGNICIMPPKQDGSKRPYSGQWTEYQNRKPTTTELESWYNSGLTGFGIICGAVSGNLETLDFDQRDIYPPFRQSCIDAGLGSLVERMEAGYMEHTPNGLHWLYRGSDISGNVKLAARPKEPGEKKSEGDKVQVLIETRGEGGFIITAPTSGTVHPSGKPYTLISGSLSAIPTITPEERRELHTIAKTFHVDDPQKVEVEYQRMSATGTGRPGDDYNARTHWSEVLTDWTLVFKRGEVSYLRRPGKTEGISGTVGWQGKDQFFCFSSSTEFEQQKPYDKFGVYALIHHGGDIPAATRALGKLGYGDQERTPPPKAPQASPVYEPIPPAAGEPYEPPKPLFMSFSDMMSETIRIKKLIGKLIQRGCTCQLFGPSGDGKTFVALGMSLAVSTGGIWNGYQCEKGLVIYFNGEGREGFKLRCRAWQKHHGITGQVDFHSSRSAIEFDAAGLRQVVIEVRALEQQTGQKVALIVIDTLARHLIGDENSTQNMSEFIKQVDGLRDTFPDSTALIVHHTGNNAEATGRSRGSSALKAAVDVEIQCMKYELTFTKMKDSSPPPPVGFKFKVVDLGFDEDGEPIDSCILEYGEMSPKNRKAATVKTTAAERTLLSIISGTPGITIEAVRAESYRRSLSILPDTKMNTLHTGFRRAVEGLTDKNLVYIEGASIFSGQWTNSGQNAPCPPHSTGQDRTPPLKGVTVVHYAEGQEPGFYDDELQFTDADLL